MGKAVKRKNVEIVLVKGFKPCFGIGELEHLLDDVEKIRKHPPKPNKELHRLEHYENVFLRIEVSPAVPGTFPYATNWGGYNYFTELRGAIGCEHMLDHISSESYTSEELKNKYNRKH